MTTVLKNTAIKAAIKRGYFSIRDDGKEVRSIALGGNLYAEITEHGTLTWPVRYVRPSDGEDTRASMGAYPRVGYKLARKKALAFMQQVADDIDPVAEKAKKRDEAKSKKRLADVLVEWFSVMRRDADISASSKIEDLRHIDQLIGREAQGRKRAIVGLFAKSTLIGDIRTEDVSRKLDVIAEKDGNKPKAKALRGTLRAVFKFAVGRGYCETNPAAIDLFDLPKSDTENHHALIKDEDVGQLMRDISGHTDDIKALTSAALQMAAHCVARPANVAGMRWEWLKDEQGNVAHPSKADRIVIPVRFMKIKKDRRTGKPRSDHRMPMTHQMRALLLSVHPITGNGDYVFAIGKKPMGEKTMQRALRESLGYGGRHTVHGFRTTFDVLLTEEEDWSERLIDLQLAHGDEAATIAAYRRMGELEKIRAGQRDKVADRLWRGRVEMMQHWSDRLDRLQGKNVIALPLAA